MERYPILLEEQASHGNATFPCAVYQVEADLKNTEKIYYHWHKELEIFFVLEGEANLRVNQETFPISAGDFAFIPTNALHMVTGEEDTTFRFIAIVFHPDFIRSFGNDTIQEKYLSPIFKWQFACPFVIKESTAYSILISEIVSSYQAKSGGYELLIKSRLLELFLMLYQYAENYQLKKQVSKDYRISMIKEMMLYLQEQCGEQVTLSEMANHFHISKGHLCRFFKEMANMSPIDYLNYYRINKSAQLLRDTDLEISAVAGQIGFNNISYFNRAFRKYMHMTPSAYRKES